MSRKPPFPSPPPDLPPDEPVFDISGSAEETDDLVKELVIREVVEHARRETRAVELARPMTSWRGRPIVLGVLAALSLFLAVHAYVFRPAWVHGPDPAAVPAPVEQAHLRYAMQLVARRVESYRAAHGGVVPMSLREIGERLPGIAYRPLTGTSYELRATTASGAAIVYRSTEPPDDFLGTSAEHLRAGAARP